MPVNGRMVKSDSRLLDVDLVDIRRRSEATAEHVSCALSRDDWEQGKDFAVDDSPVVASQRGSTS